jgi:TolB protein
MKNFSRFLLLVALVVTPAFAQIVPKKGVNVIVDNAISIRVTANTPELQKLALLAFSTHGRYDVSGTRTAAFDFKFTNSGNQVRVDITSREKSAVIASEVVTGNSPRHALLKAADVAVEKTNDLGLRGFFTARLAFLSQRSGKSEVIASDLFLGEAQQLTRDGALALWPRWSPDGSRIIYTSYFKSGAPDIYLLDPKTIRRDTFASYSGTNMGARFSPNGQQVVMISGSPSPEIYVAPAHGKQPQRKTNIPQSKSSPCWSPDGSQIIFAMGEPSPQLYVMSAAGGAPRRITTGYAFSAEPDWSRVDRNKIVCTVRVAGGKFQIAVVDMAKGETKVVSTKSVYDVMEPSWLADGRHVICTVRDRRTSALAILDTVSGNSYQITENSLVALQAGVWFP